MMKNGNDACVPMYQPQTMRTASDAGTWVYSNR